MNDTYIKLYRKLINHEIMRDPTALQIFIFTLLIANYKTGKAITGRFWASEALGINPNTFYKAQKRLEENYDLVTLSSNNKNTVVHIKNWDKYQTVGNTSSNNKVTTKEHQSNTNQEYKNIEIKNIYNKLSSLRGNDDVCSEIAQQYSVSLKSVKDIRDDLIGYCEAKGRRYKNYRSALQNWVRRALKEGKINKQQKSVLPEVEEISEEERMKNIEMIAKMKEKLLT